MPRIINFAGDPTNPEKYGFGGTWFNPDVKLRVFTSPKDWGVGRNIELRWQYARYCLAE